MNKKELRRNGFVPTSKTSEKHTGGGYHSPDVKEKEKPGGKERSSLNLEEYSRRRGPITYPRKKKKRVKRRGSPQEKTPDLRKYPETHFHGLGGGGEAHITRRLKPSQREGSKKGSLRNKKIFARAEGVKREEEGQFKSSSGRKL